MKITEITVEWGQVSRKAALCRQRFAVMSEDGTPIGTSNLSGCTGLLLFPTAAPYPCVLAHVEARTDKAEYREDLRDALESMLVRMKRQDASGLALVLLGAGGTAMGSDAEEHAAALLGILRGFKFADADILDLRNRARHSIGAARLPEGADLPQVLGWCVYFPDTGVLEASFGLTNPVDSAALPQFMVQRREASAVGTGASGRGRGCCTIL